VEVVGLLTTVTETYNRVSMHGVREEILRAQSEAAGLPLVRVPIPAPCPNEAYQQAMRTAIEAAKRQGVTRMIFGDLFLEDIRDYREKQLAGTGITPLFPLWLRPTRQLAETMICAGVVAYVTCLDPKRLPKEMAGRAFDRKFLADLPPDVDPCAERGEFHTCVTAGPMFFRPIAVELGETVERDGFVFADLKLSPGGGGQAA
jgi:diphthamide synthase (EF-2-diphthine--ammonia ligase)